MFKLLLQLGATEDAERIINLLPLTAPPKYEKALEQWSNELRETALVFLATKKRSWASLIYRDTKPWQ